MSPPVVRMSIMTRSLWKFFISIWHEVKADLRSASENGQKRDKLKRDIIRYIRDACNRNTSAAERGKKPSGAEGDTPKKARVAEVVGQAAGGGDAETPAGRFLAITTTEATVENICAALDDRGWPRGRARKLETLLQRFLQNYDAEQEQAGSM